MCPYVTQIWDFFHLHNSLNAPNTSDLFDSDLGHFLMCTKSDTGLMF